MAIGDGHSGEGRTLYTWDTDVKRVVRQITRKFPRVSVNTYECHPYCGWERRSLDVWGERGRGHPLRYAQAQLILDYVFNLPGLPNIRHYILEQTLWVAGRGELPWPAFDHSGDLRHLHVTYHPVPPPR